MMLLEPGDLLVVSMATTGGPYAAPDPSDWFNVSTSLAGAYNFAEGASDVAKAYANASQAAGAIGGRVVRIPANQLPGGK